VFTAYGSSNRHQETNVPRTRACRKWGCVTPQLYEACLACDDKVIRACGAALRAQG